MHEALSNVLTCRWKVTKFQTLFTRGGCHLTGLPSEESAPASSMLVLFSLSLDGELHSPFDVPFTIYNSHEKYQGCSLQHRCWRQWKMQFLLIPTFQLKFTDQYLRCWSVHSSYFPSYSVDKKANISQSEKKRIVCAWNHLIATKKWELHKRTLVHLTSLSGQLVLSLPEPAEDESTSCRPNRPKQRCLCWAKMGWMQHGFQVTAH